MKMKNVYIYRYKRGSRFRSSNSILEQGFVCWEAKKEVEECKENGC